MKVPAHIFYVKGDRFGRIINPNWTEEHYAPDDYEYVTTLPLETTTGMQEYGKILERIFRQMNVVDGNELPVQLKCRSLSVGDLVVIDDVLCLCAGVGWQTQTDGDYFDDLEWPDNVCRESATGKHEGDANAVTPADYEADDNIVIDIACKHCGRSGSTLIKPEDINW